MEELGISLKNSEMVNSDKIKSYKDLKVWQKSIELCSLVYHTAELFPKEEIYGLTSQIKRSAVSISSNIAEGWGRYSKKSFSYHLKIARGSLYELETQLFIAKDLNFIIEFERIESLITEISKMLFSLINSLETTND